MFEQKESGGNFAIRLVLDAVGKLWTRSLCTLYDAAHVLVARLALLRKGSDAESATVDVLL